MTVTSATPMDRGRQTRKESRRTLTRLARHSFVAGRDRHTAPWASARAVRASTSREPSPCAWDPCPPHCGRSPRCARQAAGSGAGLLNAGHGRVAFARGVGVKCARRTTETQTGEGGRFFRAEG